LNFEKSFLNISYFDSWTCPKVTVFLTPYCYYKEAKGFLFLKLFSEQEIFPAGLVIVKNSEAVKERKEKNVCF